MSQELPPLKKPPRKKLKPLGGGSNTGSIALGLAIALVGVAVAVGLVFLVLSNREEPEPEIPLDPSVGQNREQVRDPATTPARDPSPGRSLPLLIRYSSEYWSARVPTDGGWSRPQATEQGALDRTEISGPEGALAIIDFTPYERPNPSNVISTAPANLPNNFEATVVRIQGGDLCPAGTTCTDYLLPVGSGGYAVLVGWPGREQDAARLARLMARSLVPTLGE